MDSLSIHDYKAIIDGRYTAYHRERGLHDQEYFDIYSPAEIILPSTFYDNPRGVEFFERLRIAAFLEIRDATGAAAPVTFLIMMYRGIDISELDILARRRGTDRYHYGHKVPGFEETNRDSDIRNTYIAAISREHDTARMAKFIFDCREPTMVLPWLEGSIFSDFTLGEIIAAMPHGRDPAEILALIKTPTAAATAPPLAATAPPLAATAPPLAATAPIDPSQAPARH